MILAIPVTHKHKQKVDKHGKALMHNNQKQGINHCQATNTQVYARTVVEEQKKEKQKKTEQERESGRSNSRRNKGQQQV